MKTNHLKRLSTIYIVYGWLCILAFIPCAFYTIRDVIRIENGIKGSEWHSITFVLIGMNILILSFALLYLSFGRALRRESPWETRVVGFILGILMLFQFPIGTIIGGYTLWVLAKFEQKLLTKTEPIGLDNAATLRV